MANIVHCASHASHVSQHAHIIKCTRVFSHQHHGCHGTFCLQIIEEITGSAIVLTRAEPPTIILKNCLRRPTAPPPPHVKAPSRRSTTAIWNVRRIAMPTCEGGNVHHLSRNTFVCSKYPCLPIRLSDVHQSSIRGPFLPIKGPVFCPRSLLFEGSVLCHAGGRAPKDGLSSRPCFMIHSQRYYEVL